MMSEDMLPYLEMIKFYYTKATSQLRTLVFQITAKELWKLQIDNGVAANGSRTLTVEMSDKFDYWQLQVAIDSLKFPSLNFSPHFL